MEFLWEQRHRSSDLVGTVINIHNGDWVRRESGVGAGIDSYYEYLLKAYVLLGDETYLERFNKHYSAIMQYISQGPLLVDVHMHRPDRNSRNFMDALLAFWPGLQVLKGDIKSAIEIHEMLYQVTKRHNFLPEAFTTDFRVHWGQHPLRPEFVESTYFLYKATGDPYYLEVGESIMNNLEQHARVRCGFAAIKDVTTGTHENQMDSFVLAETFKYLYLLFSEPKDLVLNVDNYIFTTEAHLLPLTLSMQNHTMNITRVTVMPQVVSDEDENFDRSCRNIHMQFQGNLKFYAQNIRKPMENYVEQLCPKPKSHSTRARRLRAAEFIAGNKEHLIILKEFGIRLATLEDGRVQLLHTASDASSPEDAQEGMTFMQEMIELSKSQQQEAQQEPRVVQLMSAPYNGQTWMSAGPALFGPDLKNQPNGVRGRVIVAVPFDGCTPLTNANDVLGRIAIVERGGCMFVDKARNIERAGGIGGIVLDSHMDTTSSSSPLFAMSGDGKTEVSVPFLFLFRKEGDELLEALRQNPPLSVLLAVTPIKEDKQKETGSKTLLVKGTDNNYIVIAENKLNGNTDYEVSVQFGRVTLEFKISPYSNTDIESHLSDSENRNFKFTSEVKGSGMENMFVTYDGVIPVDEDSKPESVYVNKAVKKMLLKISQGQENEDVSDLLSRDEVIDEYNKALTHVIVTGFSGESAKIDERTVHLFNMIPGLVGGDVQVAREFFKDVIQKAEKADIPRGPEHYANAGDLTELQATQTQSTYPFGFSVQIAPAWMKVSDKHVYINGVEKIIYVTKEEYEKYVAKQGNGKVESSEVNLESSESEDNKKSGNEKVENSDLNQESSELTDELENDRGILGDQLTDEMLDEVRSTVTKDGAEVNQDSEDPYQKLLDHIQREVDLLKLKSEEEEESIEAITREYSKEQTVDTTTQVFHQLNSAAKQHGAGGVETDLENQNKVVLEVTKPTDISSERQDSGDAVGQHGGNDDRTLESDDSKRDEL